MNGQFSDATGQLWDLNFDIPTAQRVFSKTSFDLLKALSPEESKKLDERYGLLFAVIYEIVRPVAESMQMEFEEFCRRFGKNGDVLGAAGEAFQEAIINFTPSRHRQKVREAAKIFSETANQQVEKHLAKAIELATTPPAPISTSTAPTPRVSESTGESSTGETSASNGPASPAFPRLTEE